jgi:quercetin dioxygenase-like cupin family protein
MAYTGQVIENPVSGERITFRRTSADTNGELLEFDIELTPDGHVPGMHVHPAQEERFEVLGGSVRFQKGLRRVTATAGDTVVVEPGKAHKFENVGGESATMRVQVRPALEMERLFETAISLAEEGRVTSKGMPKPLERVQGRGARAGHPGMGAARRPGAGGLDRQPRRPRRALRRAEAGVRVGPAPAAAFGIGSAT